MPRRNKRKIYTTDKGAVFFSGDANNNKPECVGCAFAGYGGVCTTSDGICLKTLQYAPERKEAGNAGYQR